MLGHLGHQSTIQRLADRHGKQTQTQGAVSPETLPSVPCVVCGGIDFWSDVYDRFHCGGQGFGCEPIPGPRLVRQRFRLVDTPGGVQLWDLAYELPGEGPWLETAGEWLQYRGPQGELRTVRKGLEYDQSYGPAPGQTWWDWWNSLPESPTPEPIVLRECHWCGKVQWWQSKVYPDVVRCGNCYPPVNPLTVRRITPEQSISIRLVARARARPEDGQTGQQTTDGAGWKRKRAKARRTKWIK